MRKKTPLDPVSGPLLSSIFRFTIPLVLMNLLQIMFNASDTVIVGRFGGGMSVAAVGGTGSLIFSIVGVFSGLSVGAGVSAAQAIGARDEQRTVRTVHTAMLTAFIGGLIITSIGFFGCRFFLNIMNTPEKIIDLATTYMRIYFLGSVPNMIYVFGAAILRAAGDTKRPLYFLTFSGALNLVLNVIMVALLKLNVVGVALATVISQTVSAVLVLVSLIKRKDNCRLSFKKLGIDGRILLFILRVGIPAGLQGMLFSIANVVLQASVNSLGEIAVSGGAAAGSIEGFLWILIISFQQTALTFTGQNVGAKNYKRISKVMFYCSVSIILIGLSVGVAVFLFKDTLLGIYLTDAEAIYYGALKLSAFSLSYFLYGLIMAFSGSMQGMGASFTPMMISLVGICGVRVVWAYTVFRIERFHSMDWLYYSYPVSWIVTIAADLIFFFVFLRRLIKTGSVKRPKNAAEEAA